MGLMSKLKSSRAVLSKKKDRRRPSASLPAKLPSDVRIINVDDDENEGGVSSSCPPLSITMISLATGTFSSSGVFSITSGRSPSPHSNATESVGSFSDGEGDEEGESHHLRGPSHSAPTTRLSPIREVVVSSRSAPSRAFIRTADLPHMNEAAVQSRHSSFSDLADDELVEHLHKTSSRSPLPTIEHDPNECWVALDDGNGCKAPLAEAAMASLVRTGLDAAMDRGMWTANGSTAKLLKSGAWDDTAFVSAEERRAVPAPHPRGSKGEDDVLVWSGSWSHKYYGHELPAIRCEAIVNMPPKDLADLFVDSTRIKEYNKMSLGRDDVLVLHEEERRVTKVSIARTKPPMLSKILVLKNLLHLEELPGGGDVAGYLFMTRAVAHAGDAEVEEDPKVVHSEMLMGCCVIRAVEGDPNRCVLINLNHLRSPMIPMMMAKRLGLSAAVNFINDVRALCSR
ncbi:hypothetical protein ACHAWF_003044 [Thalassiosira exigua]